MSSDPQGLRPFERFLGAVEKATNETQKREAFIALAATGFEESEFATDLALAAEYRVHFKRAGVLRRGAVDSFYGNLIIEFENDLEKTREHALGQLRNYVVGAWTEDKTTDRPYLAVLADGVAWEVFVPKLKAGAPLASENINLEPVESWARSATSGAASLREFLNRLFFRKTLLKPTSANFARDFGLTSPSFLRARATLVQKLAELVSDPQLQVYRKAWSASLQISYGSVESPKRCNPV